jgi:transmembrane sensor
MSQQPNHQVDDQLLAKYLSGEAAPEEAILVESWLAEPMNQNHYQQASMLWTALSGEAPHQLPGQETVWQELRKQMNLDHAPVKIKRSGTIYRLSIAAALVLTIAAGMYWLFFQKTAQPVTATTEQITRKADQHILRDTLPDGSTLVLNSSSSIDYPRSFSPSARQLQLSGEAWFDIQPKPGWPFHIQAGPVIVKVLGTRFNILENADSVVVSLASGSVRMCAGSDSITLQPGQQGVYDIRHRRFSLAGQYDANRTSYATRVFEFNNASLGEMAATIAKAYEIEIIFSNPALADCTMSSTFEDQSIDYIMNVIAATIGIEFRIENKKVYISGNSCE